LLIQVSFLKITNVRPDFILIYSRVDESLRIRVADFGLTRDIYSTEYYKIEKHVTLPVKWMALESLLDGYFDEKTDVVCIVCVACTHTRLWFSRLKNKKVVNQLAISVLHQFCIINAKFIWLTSTASLNTVNVSSESLTALLEYLGLCCHLGVGPRRNRFSNVTEEISS